MSGLDILPNITDVRFKDIWGRGARSAVRQGGRPDQTRRLQTGPDWSIDLPHWGSDRGRGVLQGGVRYSLSLS